LPADIKKIHSITTQKASNINNCIIWTCEVHWCSCSRMWESSYACYHDVYIWQFNSDRHAHRYDDNIYYASISI